MKPVLGKEIVMEDTLSGPREWTNAVDVVVVGCGGAGAAAAIEAHDVGAEVLIVEKMPAAGGSTLLSGGITYAANSVVQRAQGITDSADAMAKYWMATGKGFNDPELVQVISVKSAETIQWLADLGITWEKVSISGAEELPEYAAVTPPKPRAHFPKGGGAHVFRCLLKAVEARRINVLLETPARKLITNAKGEVVGVKAETEGKSLCIKAKRGVVLSSGGFANNKELLRLFSPRQGYKGVLGCAVSSTGDGHRMAMAIGASLRSMSALCAMPGVQIEYPVPEPNIRASRLHGARPYIFVNERGQRFTDETFYYAYVGYAVARQDFAYVIFDAAAITEKGGKAICPAFSDLDKQIDKGVVVTAPTIRALAAKIGIREFTRLEDTVNAWNRYVEAGHDAEFGRTQALIFLRNPPFYASEIVAHMIDTAGGLLVNTNMQVLHVEGHSIPRLYAAGLTTGGIIGAIYPGSGSALQTALCTGRIAGQNAAAETAWE